MIDQSRDMADEIEALKAEVDALQKGWDREELTTLRQEKDSWRWSMLIVGGVGGLGWILYVAEVWL